MAELTNRLVALVRRADTESDTELISRFLDGRDGEAFAALVRRHGPMVLAVCRRILRHHADADDAFQATFLILARRAGSVRKRSMLANWLYGVAYRTALEARRAMAVRRAKEATAASMKPEIVTEADAAPDLRDVLDRELTALPDVYRAAVVLCELEGVSRKEAAARLGWSEGTLSSRLSRARALLARRLSKYGLAVPAGGVVAIAQQASAESVAALTNSVARIGTLVAAGEAAVSAPVAALMEGTMKAMLLTKLKATATALVVGCAVLMTATAGWQANAAGVADQPGVTKAVDPPRKAARDADKDRIKELERERDRLRRELEEVRDRLAKVEDAHRAAAAKIAWAERVANNTAARERERAVTDLRTLEATRERLKTPPATSTAPDVASLRPEPVRPGSVAPFRENTPLPGTTAGSAPPITDNTRPTTIEPIRPPAVAPVTSAEGAPGPAVGLPPPGRASNPEPTRPSVSIRGPGVPMQEPLPPAPAKAPTVVKVYQVRGLAADAKEGEALAKVVRAVVEPQSWGADAGVEYLPGSALLVVRQTAKGHEEVEKLLAELKVHAAAAGRK